ncbi:MAG: phosphate ABC transporter substrate-binding protein PstS [Janthinobacterium lividum]
MTINLIARAALVATALSAGALSARAADISGAGSTFIYPVLAKWADTYKKDANVGVNYQSIGSGGGLKAIKANTVTFGASDAPLHEKDLDEAGLVQWPMIMGGIVPVLNLDGVKAGDITLDGATLAKMYMGDIKTWNDPAIAKLNPGMKLPETPIVVVHRADGSGTTFNFTNYLSKVSPDWKSKIGENTAVEWPVGLGAKGNEGVANNVANTKGALGYVEYAYAKQNNLVSTKMVNHDGKTVAPAMDTFSSAAANADWEHAPGFYQILTDQPGAQSWPITASTFVLMHKKPMDAAASAEALKFFDWSFKNGGKAAEALDYIPMPAKVVSLVAKEINGSIKSADGKPVFDMK